MSTDVYVPSSNTIDHAVISVDNSSPGLAGSLETWAKSVSVDVAHNISFSFEATDTNATVYLSVLQPTIAWGTVTDYAHFDNISVRPSVDDRSVNNNGLQVIGEIDKTPVAPGADLVAYSGFSANNYLVQPYNEDLNFGTGDFCVMGWVNLNDEAHLICSLASYDGANYTNNYGIQIHKNGGGALNWRCTIDNFASTQSVSSSIPLNTWVFVVGTISGGMLRLYINGVDAGHLQTNLYDFDNPEAVLNVGSSHSGGSNNENTKISLLRITSTTPTPEQIAKIYRDEKALFQDGAQATLYGSSDSVTALAYDEKTELLHVGTTSGRSDFSGLRRINNTTTAITTSISAHNNLIAEQ